MIDTTFLTEDITTKKEGHMELTDVTVEAVRSVYDIIQPKRILEIGFNAGHSAVLALELLPEVKVSSIDIGRHKYTKVNADKVIQKYGSRFKFTVQDSKELDATKVKGRYDTIFIDGDHSIEGLTSDLKFANSAEIGYIIVDDYHPKWFQSVIDLVDHYENKQSFPYERICTFDYDSRDGINTAILLKRVK